MDEENNVTIQAQETLQNEAKETAEQQATEDNKALEAIDEFFVEFEEILNAGHDDLDDEEYAAYRINANQRLAGVLSGMKKGEYRNTMDIRQMSLMIAQLNKNYNNLVAFIEEQMPLMNAGVLLANGHLAGDKTVSKYIELTDEQSKKATDVIRRYAEALRAEHDNKTQEVLEGLKEQVDKEAKRQEDEV